MVRARAQALAELDFEPFLEDLDFLDELSLFELLDESLLEDELLFVSLELLSELESLESDGFFFPPSRKSVTYQPVPFKWKAAAETFFFRRSFPHEGHLRFAPSLNF